MALPRRTRLELQIVEALWSRVPCSVRGIQEAFPERNRSAYPTIQTTVYRLEGNRAVRRVKKIGNTHIFEEWSRAYRGGDPGGRVLGLLGGRTQPEMAHLVESGKLTLAEVQEAEKALRSLARKDKLQ